MTVLISCLIIAILLCYFSKAPLISAMNKSGGYDNHNPRLQAQSLTGFGARAWAGHQNSFESLLIFSIAVLTAISTNHTGTIIQGLAVLHIILRCIYHVVFLMNLASLRTFIWFLGLLCSLIILVMCI